jgi:hypothetical protein
MVLAHELAYRLAVPDEHARALVLARSGHAYWLLAVKAAVILGLSGAGAFFVRLVRPAATRSGSVESYTRILVPLAALQAVVFTGTEIAERLTVGSPVGTLFQHHLFVLGLAVQFLVACAGALVLHALARSARAVAELLARRWAPAARTLSLGHHRGRAFRPALALAGAAGPRSPPLV